MSIMNVWSNNNESVLSDPAQLLEYYSCYHIELAIFTNTNFEDNMYIFLVEGCENSIANTLFDQYITNNE